MRGIMYKLFEASLVAIMTIAILTIVNSDDTVVVSVLAAVITTLLYSLIPGGG